ncbi:MAG TPA: VOC family protein [Steroidobacteraceae bacterium]|nr:VOC family protein [Steroidobacteraceae bacterium]
MRIIGPDYAVFGVEDLDACKQYMRDYGLIEAESSASGGIYRALDNTYIEIRKHSDKGLPPAMSPSPNVRETVYGVETKADLEAIGAELSRDRDVTSSADGTLRSQDDSGFHIGFRVARRVPINAAPLGVNCPGQPPQRGPNIIASYHDAVIVPRTFSHIVYFVPDVQKAERFYIDRLKFRLVDRFTNAGPFLRPAANQEHHTLFLIQARPGSTGHHAIGCNHFTFHVSGANEMFQAGWHFARKGYKSFWGPGRHILGSNYFWYFNSPFGCAVEYDADMDLHDDSWVPREVPADKHTSQIFLFDYKEPWSPGSPETSPSKSVMD